MNWNISAWSIRQPVPSLVLFMVLIALGYVSFGQLPVTRFPNIDVPIVQVRVYQSGAGAVRSSRCRSPRRSRTPIAGVNGVKHQTSAVTEGSSVTTIEFRLEVNQDRALNDVKDAIARIRAELPRTIDEPIVTRIDDRGPADRHLLGARAGHDAGGAVLVRRRHGGARAAGRARRVARSSASAASTREIRVALDPDRLLRLRHHRRRRQPAAAGDQRRPGRRPRRDRRPRAGDPHARRQAVVADLAATVIVLPRGRRCASTELGTVTDATAEPRTFAALDGQPGGRRSPSRAPRARATSRVAADVARRSHELQRAYPNVELKLDRPDGGLHARRTTTRRMKTLIEGAILAIIVVFALPARLARDADRRPSRCRCRSIPAFWAIDAVGFSLNLVSLLAITMVTGILVDDAIVEIENIVRHMRDGQDRPTAPRSRPPTRSASPSSPSPLTIIAVFVPVSFMGGIAGQYFKQFGLDRSPSPCSSRCWWRG